MDDIENIQQLTYSEEEALTLGKNGNKVFSHSDSLSSKIMSVRETNPLLIIALYFVFSNIFLGRIFNFVSLVFMLILCGMAGYHWSHPEYFPKWMVKPFDICIYRIKIFPYELIIILGIFYMAIIQITHPFTNFKWYQFNSCLLIVIAYYLTELGNKASYTDKRGLKIFWELSLRPFYHQISGKKKKRRVESLTDNENEEKISQEKNAEIMAAKNLSYPGVEKQGLKRAQLDRWKKWIQEEMQRLGSDVSPEDNEP